MSVKLFGENMEDWMKTERAQQLMQLHGQNSKRRTPILAVSDKDANTQGPMSEMAD